MRGEIMVTIPRYRQRTQVPLGGLQYSSAFGRTAGEDLRDASQALGAVSSIVGSVSGLFGKGGPAGAGSVGGSGAAGGRSLVDAQEALANWGDQAAALMREAEADPEQGGSSLESVATGLQALGQKVGQGLNGAVRPLFEAEIAQRQDRLIAEASARTARALDARAIEASARLEAQGVEDYLRQADLDEGLGRMALASAVAQRGARLRAVGHDQDQVRDGQRQLLAETEGRRVAQQIASDPEAAAALLDRQGGVLPETARKALAGAIEAERVRREAAKVVGDLAGASATVADDLDGLLERSRVAAGDDPLPAAAYRGAAIGAWRTARRIREADEDAAWDGVAPYLSADSGVTAWTDLPGEVWADLTDRQKAAVQSHFDAPWRESDPEVMGELVSIASSDIESFCALDLGGLVGKLSPRDVGRWKQLQSLARSGQPIAEKVAYVAQQERSDAFRRIIEGDPVWTGRGRQAPGPAPLPRQTRALNLDLGKVEVNDGWQVDPRTGRFFRPALGPDDAAAGYRAYDPIYASDLEAQRATERRLKVGEEIFGQRSSKEIKIRESEKYRLMNDDYPEGFYPYMKIKSSVDWDRIAVWESSSTSPKTSLYFPMPGKSGPTIGHGADIGQKAPWEIRSMGLDSALTNKLLPYANVRGDAARRLVAERPLTLSRDEVDRVDAAFRDYDLGRLIKAFNADSKIGDFQSLPGAAQTVIASVFFNYGGPKKAPVFWDQVTHGHWEDAYRNLMDFGDGQYRRKEEAKLLRDALDEHVLRDPKTPGRGPVLREVP
ncbi:MAG: hypothetical protein KF842_06345 [Caulobacter sp.]|nr:hypothetical protein [Caulobacter sp.]